MRQFFLTFLIAVLAATPIRIKAETTDYDADAALAEARKDIPNWMKYLPDNMFVAHASIPGTHDTMTGHKWIDANSISTASAAQSASTTQEVTLQQQLLGGVRAFDFRPALHKNTLYCAHGMSLTEVTFDAAMNQLCEYLDEHPTEFFIMHLFRGNVYSKGSNIPITTKWAGGLDDDDSRAQYAGLLENLLNTGTVADHIVDFSPYLRIKDVRGKIIIFRRDRINFVNITKAANIENWTMQYVPANPSPIKNASNPALAGILHAQDVSSPGDSNDAKDPETNLDAEKRYCLALLKDSREQVRPNSVSDPLSYKPFWVMNFTSGCNANGTTNGTKGYKDNASIMNPLAVEDIRNASVAGPTGIIFSDYVLIDKTADGKYATAGNDIVTTVLENNFSYASEFILDDSKFTSDPSANTDIFQGKEYFLRNVGTGQFFSAGADWGTHAALKPTGIRITPMHDNYSDTYKLKTTFRQSDTDNYLGSNMFIDNTTALDLKAEYAGYGNVFAFTFSDDDGTVNAITPVGTTDTYADGTIYKIDAAPYTKGDTMQQWELITEAELMAELAAKANPDNGVDMTFMVRGHSILPNDGENEKWAFTTHGGKFLTKYYSAYKEFTGTNTITDKDLVFRAYNNAAKGASKYTPWELEQTISSLPNGVYEVTFQAVASVTLKSCSVGGINLLGKIPSGSGLSAEQAVTKFRNEAESYRVSTGRITVRDNQIKIEMSKDGNATATDFFFDNFTLTYYGPEDMVTLQYTPLDEWDTIILPFEADIPEDWVVYNVYGKTANERPFYYIIDKEYSEFLHANTPYLVNIPASAARSGSYATQNFYGVPTNDKDTYSEGLLTGTHVEATAATNHFVLTNHNSYGNCFVRVQPDEETIIPAHRAYIVDPTLDSQSEVNHLFLEPGDNLPTSVMTPVIDNDTMVDVFTVGGIAVRHGVRATEALDGLESGFYILRSAETTMKVAKTL